MPTYAYRCAACGHEFDAHQRFADDPLRDCPVCTGAIRRVIQPVGVVFKGSGWYITDSRKQTDDGKAAAKAETADGAKSDGAKVDGGKGDGAKGDGAKPDGAKSDGKAADAAPAKRDGAKGEPAPVAAKAAGAAASPVKAAAD